jgi:RimJ/RimL family protein N-acetyltransferase
MSSPKEFKAEVWDRSFDQSSTDCLYAIFDKTIEPRSGEACTGFAEIISLSATNPTHASTEIGMMVIPHFQRTHVATNAVGLLLLWLLDPPSAGGLGLRRVEWRAHAENVRSRDFAARVGFVYEGIARWQRVVSFGKVGTSAEALAIRNQSTCESPGKHIAVYSIVWDEWEEKRTRLVPLMVSR